MGNLMQKVQWFVAQPGLESELLDYSQVMRKKSLDYEGNVVTKPHALTLAQILPALPPVELGGAVNAVDLATGYIREVLLDPGLVITDREHWSDVPSAKVHASREEWQMIGEELLRRGICEPIPAEDLIYHRGQLLAAGAFGVPKVGKKVKMPHGEEDALRLIINM
eukprot:6475573-Amphidinium_carterae.1